MRARGGAAKHGPPLPAAFAAPSASAAAEVNLGASYEELSYAPAPDASLVERSNPAMGAGERERLGTANARTGAISPASTATLSGIAAHQSSAQGVASGQALAQGRSAWTPSGGTLGMDVSSHQQNVDWASAHAACAGALVSYTGTEMAPAYQIAKSMTVHSKRVRLIMPTRSPGRMPAAIMPLARSVTIWWNCWARIGCQLPGDIWRRYSTGLELSAR